MDRQLRRQREAVWCITAASVVAVIVLYLAIVSALGG